MNAIEIADWPEEDLQDDAGETVETSKQADRHPSKSALTWMFGMLLLIFITNGEATQVPEHMGTPMLCQSHVAQTVCQVPSGFNCSLALLDGEPGPVNATKQTFKQNVRRNTRRMHIYVHVSKQRLKD